MGRSIMLRLSAAALALFMIGFSPADASDYSWKSPEESARHLENLAGQNKDIATLHNLGKTPGGRQISILQLSKGKEELPGIFVAANMEGDSPLATHAALRLADLLVSEWSEELSSHRWYILAVGNPDGYARFFDSPRYASFVNDRPFNDDKDNATDEDGPDDLNKDGFITMMRQAHPDGNWLPVNDNPVLMKRADRGKGETGKYRLFVEGIDNDGDGSINEDGPGGANPGHNFPHNFKHYTTTDGLWAASESESRAVLRFAFDRPDIALFLSFGRANSLKEVPSGSGGAKSAQDSYKVPKNMARRWDLDPEKEYPIKELLEMAKEITGYSDLTEDMVIQWLGVGAAVKPDGKDVAYWEEITKRYGEFIKDAGFDGKRLDPARFASGSIEEWAYFQFGVPSFAVDFWTVPVVEKKEEKNEGSLTPDEIEKMSDEEFIELGPEKIDAILKDVEAGPQFTSEMVINALKGGMMSTKRMAKMMRKKMKEKESGGADEDEQALYDYNADAFVPWQEYDHPTLGAVEIGGMKPYADLVPSSGSVDSMIDGQLPFVRTLASLLPDVAVGKIEIKQRTSDIWEVECWVMNNGFLPYPTYQGKRCQRPGPVVVTLKGDGIMVLEGRERQPVDLIPGSGGNETVRWLVQARKGSKLRIDVNGFAAGNDSRTFTIEEGGN